jgi:hypothetical protein
MDGKLNADAERNDEYSQLYPVAQAGRGIRSVFLNLLSHGSFL